MEALATKKEAVRLGLISTKELAKALNADRDQVREWRVHDGMPAVPVVRSRKGTIMYWFYDLAQVYRWFRGEL